MSTARQLPGKDAGARPPTRIRRLRSRQRGAAFTEFLAIVPAFIAVNVSLLWLWGAYGAKRTTISESRHGAWSSAITGCRGGGASGSGVTMTSPGSDPSLQQLSGQVQQAKQAAQASPNLRAPFETLTKQENGAKATKAHGQGKTVFGTLAASSYSTEGVVLCNEIPKPLTAADEKSVVDDAWKKYVGQ